MRYTTLDDATSEDVLDSRDLITLRKDLEAELEDLTEAVEEDGDGVWTDNDLDERNRLENEIDEILEIENCSPDWEFGVTLINEDHFENYARQFAEDIGAIEDDARWPATCIDWEHAARELAMDYTSVTLNGIDWYVR